MKHFDDIPTLLLVEDSEDDAFFFRRVLQKISRAFHLEHALNGAAAVEFLRKSMASQQGAEPPDLIFLDLKMPVLSGFDVLTWIRQQKFSQLPPVIVLSGSDHTEDKKRAMELGACEYLVKPIRLESLKAALNISKSFALAATAESKPEQNP